MPKVYLQIICGIYMITSPSGKKYIGQAVHIHRRWDWYKAVKCESQRYLYNSFKKHGVENHKFEIIEECQQEMLDEREIHYIKFYDTYETPHGLNLKPGGEGGALSGESLKKLSKSITEYWANIPKEKRKQTPESNEKRRVALIGNTNTLGYKHTSESLEKKSKSMIGNTNTLGYKQSTETIEKRKKSFANKTEEEVKSWREKQRIGSIKASEIRKSDPEYYSEENVQKRKDSTQRGNEKRRKTLLEYNARIRQERLTMIF